MTRCNMHRLSRHRHFSGVGLGKYCISRASGSTSRTLFSLMEQASGVVYDVLNELPLLKFGDTVLGACLYTAIARSACMIRDTRIFTNGNGRDMAIVVGDRLYRCSDGCSDTRVFETIVQLRMRDTYPTSATFVSRLTRVTEYRSSNAVT